MIYSAKTYFKLPVISVAHGPLRWSNTLTSEVIKSLQEVQLEAKEKNLKQGEDRKEVVRKKKLQFLLNCLLKSLSGC